MFLDDVILEIICSLFLSVDKRLAITAYHHGTVGPKVSLGYFSSSRVVISIQQQLLNKYLRMYHMPSIYLHYMNASMPHIHLHYNCHTTVFIQLYIVERNCKKKTESIYLITYSSFPLLFVRFYRREISFGNVSLQREEFLWTFFDYLGPWQQVFYFCLSKVIFILLSFVKNIFIEYGNFCSFSRLQRSFHCLCLHCFSWEVSCYF